MILRPHQEHVTVELNGSHTQVTPYPWACSCGGALVQLRNDELRVVAVRCMICRAERAERL